MNTDVNYILTAERPISPAAFGLMDKCARCCSPELNSVTLSR